jgi:hypothetical protein
LFLPVALIVARESSAQQLEEVSTPAADDVRTNSEASEPKAEPSVEERMREMEAALKTQQKETEQLKAQSKSDQDKTKALESEFSVLKDTVATTGAVSEDLPPEEDRFSVFGFFDLTYYKGFYDESSLYQLYLPSAGSFTMTNLNVFLKSKMTETLSAIAEIRFSFLPLGFERSFEAETVLPDGTTLDSGAEYDRVNTTVRDPLTTGEFQQGGVTIERVHLTYTPFDWLGVIAGRFLTPYGIWNIDHGSPVVIPARVPNMLYRAFVPPSQLGLQIFGRFFPGKSLLLDYAVTLSNGRGPTESVLDLDENKAIGLRLKLTYIGKNVTFFAGTYGYFGEYTDVKKRTVVRLDNDLTLDEDQEDVFITKVIPVEAYKEYVVSSDISLSLFGVTLQAEAVWRRVNYSVHGLMDPASALINGGDATKVYYFPNYDGYGAYVLLYYNLPLPEKWRIQIAPYVMYERGFNNEVVPLSHLNLFYAGLNVKPSAFITLKAEFMRSYPDSSFLETINALTLQLAVSF